MYAPGMRTNYLVRIVGASFETLKEGREIRSRDR